MNELKINREDMLKIQGVVQSDRILSMDHESVLGEAADIAVYGRKAKGDRLPWGKTWEDVGLDAGELTIWAGVNSHGKTSLLCQVMANLLPKRRILICSMEEKPAKIIATMATQVRGCTPSPGFVNEWATTVRESGYILDWEGNIDSDVILGLQHYAARNLGIDHMVIDNLTTIDIDGDDLNRQKHFVNELRAFAKQYGMHVHLVCHCRKPQNEFHAVTKFDVKGSGSITDLADKVFVVQRNKQREHHIMLMNNGGDYDQEIIESPMSFLKLEKNRQLGIEKKYGLWLDFESGQYTEVENSVMQLGEAA